MNWLKRFIKAQWRLRFVKDQAKKTIPAIGFGTQSVYQQKGQVVLHCMIDLETLSTASDAYIRTLGACFFDANGVRDSPEDTFYESCDGTKQPGADIDPLTVAWWDSQSAKAKKALENTKGYNLDNVLLSFRNWVEKEKQNYSLNGTGTDVVVWMWGNGGDFDPVVLGNAFKRARIAMPWPFWATRCYRTLKNVHKNIYPEAFIGEQHNALDDAIYQAQHAVKILRRTFW